MKNYFTTLILLSLVSSFSASCTGLSKSETRRPAAEFPQKSGDTKDYYLFSAPSLADGENQQRSSFEAGPDYPFNATSPENKLALSPDNWGRTEDGKPLEGATHVVPEIVAHIGTESVAGYSGQIGAALLAKSGSFIYLPIRLESSMGSGGWWKSGIQDFGEYKIFDIAKLKHRSIAPPKATFQQYEIFTGEAHDPYRQLHPAISPSGKLGARMVWALDAKTKTLQNTLAVWDLETGEIRRLINLPINFFSAAYKSVETKCDARTDYLQGVCTYNPSGQALSVVPSAPFFVSDSEVVLPLVYLASSRNEYYPDSMKFLFQSLDLAKEEQTWEIVAEKNKILIPGKSTFTYAQVDRNKPQDTELTSKDLEIALRYDSASRLFRGRGDRLGFPGFSAATLDRSLVSMVSDFKGIPERVPYRNPKPLPKDTEGRLGTKMVIAGTGDFGYAILGKNRGSHRHRKFFTIDGKEEVLSPQATAGFSDSLPSFYPSLHQPSFAYEESYFAQETYRFADDLVNLKEFSGTEMIAAWSDASLPPGHYFAKLFGRSKLFDSNAGLKETFGARIDRYSGIEFDRPQNTHGKRYWEYATLAVVKLVPQNILAPTGWEKCQTINELGLEVCNQIRYSRKVPGKLYSGNFYLKSGEKLLLKKVDAEVNDPAPEGCWYGNCGGSRTVRFSADIPGYTGVTLNVTKINSYECTYSARGSSCADGDYVISGSVKKRKAGVNEKEPEDKKYDSYELNLFMGGKSDKY